MTLKSREVLKQEHSLIPARIVTDVSLPAVVFLRRYGADATLASALLLAATIISSFTLTGVFWFVG